MNRTRFKLGLPLYNRRLHVLRSPRREQIVVDDCSTVK